jgi:hypothetical protein
VPIALKSKITSSGVLGNTTEIGVACYRVRSISTDLAGYWRPACRLAIAIGVQRIGHVRPPERAIRF